MSYTATTEENSNDNSDMFCNSIKYETKTKAVLIVVLRVLSFGTRNCWLALRSLPRRRNIVKQIIF